MEIMENNRNVMKSPMVSAIQASENVDNHGKSWKINRNIMKSMEIIEQSHDIFGKHGKAWKIN